MGKINSGVMGVWLLFFLCFLGEGMWWIRPKDAEKTRPTYLWPWTYGVQSAQQQWNKGSRHFKRPENILRIENFVWWSGSWR